MTASSSSGPPFFVTETKLPIKLESEANVSSSKTWHYRARRTKAQLAAVALGMRSLLSPLLTARVSKYVDGAGVAWQPTISQNVRLVVEITRIAPRLLDSDNAVGAAKHVRDGVATLLGINDRDRRVDWIVVQQRGEPKEYATKFKISAWREEQP